MKVVFILGTGHCGSTLLDLILGSHYNMFSLGEVYRVVSANPPEPICDICENSCEFWRPELLKDIRISYKDNFLKRLGHKLGFVDNKSVSFYKKISLATNNKVLVDSSKKPGWIIKNGDALRASNIQPILIYLSRDGRAVVNSYYRKYPKRGLQTLSHNWNSRINAINSCYDSWPLEHRIHIRYEDLAKNAMETIHKLVNFMDIPFEDNMMCFWKHKHHPINGNAGTKSMLLKFRSQHRHEQWVQDNEKEYYKEKELAIQFDERWRRELSLNEITVIEGIISRLNNNLKENV